MACDGVYADVVTGQHLKTTGCHVNYHINSPSLHLSSNRYSPIQQTCMVLLFTIYYKLHSCSNVDGHTTTATNTAVQDRSSLPYLSSQHGLSRNSISLPLVPEAACHLQANSTTQTSKLGRYKTQTAYYQLLKRLYEQSTRLLFTNFIIPSSCKVHYPPCDGLPWTGAST